MLDRIRDILQTKKVGVAGAGGLGSNCAIALARAGVGNLVIADFDIIDASNLNRQYFFADQIGMKKVMALKENILRITPYINVEIYDIKLRAEDIIPLYASCDILVEAFDRADMKEMLIETALEYFPDKPVVAGSGLAGWGNNNVLKTRRLDNLYICGDEETEASEELPPLAPRVGIVANMQANLVLELLLDNI